MVSNSGTERSWLNGISSSAGRALGFLSSHLYTALIFALAIGLLWLAATLSSAQTLSQVRPTLQTALAPLAALFGAVPEAPASGDTIQAHGQVVAMSSFDVAARTSGKTVFIVSEGATVTKGQVLVRLDDSAARATLVSAERALAEARAELARVPTSPVVDSAGVEYAYEQGATVLSNIHLNLTWIFAATDSVLNERDLRETQSNSYVYADLIRAQDPDIMDLRMTAAEDDEEVRNAYAKALAAYKGMSRGATQSQLDAALAEAYAILETNADALKSTALFLAAVREGHEDADLTMPETLADHEESIIDAQRTTNDNLEAVANVRENIRTAKGGSSDTPDIASLQQAVADRQKDVEEARGALERYVVTSPVSGTIAEVKVPEGSAVVDGQIITTVTTDSIVAKVAFSETDITRVKTGDPVRLTLDGAGFTIDGQVVSIDSNATVENGIVAFYAIIGFNDPRVRIGMSATAHITR